MSTRSLRTFVWLPTLVGFAAMAAWSGAQTPAVGGGFGPAPNDPHALGRVETHGTIAIDAGSFVIAFRKDSNVFLGYSAEDGSWDRHEFPEKVVADPVVSGSPDFSAVDRGSTGAFRLSGDAIEELVAVDRHGRFQTVKLEQPASGKLTPYMVDGLILHVVDDRVYAFSTQTGTWDVLAVPKEAGVEVRVEGSISVRGLSVNGGKAVYSSDEGCSAFSVDSGKWTSATFAADDR